MNDPHGDAGAATFTAKQTAEKAQEQQDVVLKEAQQLNIDSLYKSPPLRTWPPTDVDTDNGAEQGGEQAGETP